MHITHPQKTPSLNNCDIVQFARAILVDDLMALKP
jgi:hypothetical protein